MLEFRLTTEYGRGTVLDILSKGFDGLWNDELEEKISQYDKDISINPDTIGACAFITTYNGKAIGMASWDPRQGPELGTIGYNCIVPEFQGRGLGKSQVVEVLRILREQGFEKAFVTTGEHPFFEVASNMYLSCGFTEIKRYNDGRDPRFGSVDYEIIL